MGTTTLLQHYGGDDYTNFTSLQPSVGIDNDNNKHPVVIEENQDDESMENESVEKSEDIYTTFDVAKGRSSNNNGCGGRMMMCCVADSEYGDLEEFLEANNRQRRRKNRRTKQIKNQQKVQAQPSYLCQSLDCFGALCFWKNESTTTDATVKTSDF